MKVREKQNFVIFVTRSEFGKSEDGMAVEKSQMSCEGNRVTAWFEYNFQPFSTNDSITL